MARRKDTRESYEYDEWGRDEYKSSKKKQKPRQANTYQPDTRAAYKKGDWYRTQREFD